MIEESSLGRGDDREQGGGGVGGVGCWEGLNSRFRT